VVDELHDEAGRAGERGLQVEDVDAEELEVVTQGVLMVPQAAGRGAA